MSNTFLLYAKQDLEEAKDKLLEFREADPSVLNALKSEAFYWLRKATDDVMTHVLYEVHRRYDYLDLASHLNTLPEKYDSVLVPMWLSASLLDQADTHKGSRKQPCLYPQQLVALYNVLEDFIRCVENLSPDVEYPTNGISFMKL